MTNHQVTKDIAFAHEVINDNSHHPNKTAQSPNYFLKLYPFTNENLSSSLKNYQFNNHHILTVGSSADQALNFIFKGANHLTLMDVNPFVKYYFDLKTSAIFNLDRETFLNFFYHSPISFPSLGNGNFLNDKDYYQLSLSLPQDSKLFWDTLFNTYSPSVIQKHFFMKGELSKKELIKNNPYLQVDNFNQLRHQLTKSNLIFLEDNILNIANLHQTYDDIYLSNVLDYLFTFQFTKTGDNYEMHSTVTKEYLQFLKLVITKLNPGGVLFFHYMWDIYNNRYQYYSAFDKMIAHHPNVTKLTFSGSHHLKDELDSLYIYTKKLK